MFWSISAVYHSSPYVLSLLLGRQPVPVWVKGVIESYVSFLKNGELLSFQGALRAYYLLAMPAAAGVSAWMIYFAVLDRQLGLREPAGPAAKWRKRLWPLPLCTLVSASICARHEIWWNDLRFLEHRTARSIVQTWQMYEIENPGVTVTNLAQLLATWPEARVSAVEQSFRAFGRYGQCEDSLYAKYSFIPPGAKGRFIHGELLVISARPYPSNSDGELERVIISRTGPSYEGLTCTELKEKWVAQLFAEAERSLPVRPASRLCRKPQCPWM